MFNQPDQLGNLAVEAFGQHVSQLLVELVRYPNCVQEVCGQLQKMILRTVSPHLANDLTIKLLRHLDRSYRELCENAIYSSVADVASEILCAIIHPDVMRLECSAVISHYTLIDLYKARASRLIYISLPMLKRLKVQKLGQALENSPYRYSLTYISETLEKFSSPNCRDEDVELLSISCKQLQSLDLTNSFRVSDESVPFFTKFQCLEELNVSGTSISQNGVRELLTALSKTEVPGSDCPVRMSLQLKRFECDNLSILDISLLVDNFKNLTTLLFRHIRMHPPFLVPLKRLTQMRNFTLCHAPYRELGVEFLLSYWPSVEIRRHHCGVPLRLKIHL
jgi:hypothetical protein